MAKLSSFKVDSHAIEDGEWVRVGEDYDDLEIYTRGLTDKYTDAQTARQRRHAQTNGIEIDQIPVKIRRKINIDCLIQHVILGVRNLVDDETEKEVSLPEFHELMRNPDYAPLTQAAFRAAQKVGNQRAADIDDAVGNSVAGSSGS